jgi:hypothetical protein
MDARAWKVALSAGCGCLLELHYRGKTTSGAMGVACKDHRAAPLEGFKGAPILGRNLIRAAGPWLPARIEGGG